MSDKFGWPILIQLAEIIMKQTGWKGSAFRYTIKYDVL